MEDERDVGTFPGGLGYNLARMSTKRKSTLESSYARLPQFTGFSHEELAEWLATIPVGSGTSFNLGNRESLYLDSKTPGSPWASSAMFVRLLVKDWRKADPQKDYKRFEVFDVDGILRTNAKTKANLAFIAELYPKAQQAIARANAKRSALVKSAVRRAPKLDRLALTELIIAATWGKVEVGPIVDAIMLSTRDPAKYIAQNKAACAEFGIRAPVKGLHEVALQQQLPEPHLLAFDWKESMHEVVPMLADVLSAGPGITLDATLFEAKYEKWERAPREKALAEIAKTLKLVALIQVKVDADAVVVVCVDKKHRRRIRDWSRKVSLPMLAL